MRLPVATAALLPSQYARIPPPAMQYALQPTPMDALAMHHALHHNRNSQSLGNHRFLIASDMAIRVPREAQYMLEQLVHHETSGGSILTQVESWRPRHKVRQPATARAPPPPHPHRHSQVRWSSDAARMLGLPNAGGSSLCSEALSFEMLARAFGARLEMTEMELRYTPGSQITDYACRVFNGCVLGVSVTRAVVHRGNGQLGGHLCDDEAYRLLSKKLAGINISTRNIQNMRWRKQVLHVWAQSRRDAGTLERQYAALPQHLRTNTVMLTSITSGVDWIYGSRYGTARN